jgi:gamma-glutamyltranspeptidase / glutathione hydrolase
MSKMKRNLFFLLLFRSLLFADQPEAESGFLPKEAVYGKTCMAVSANPFATKAGFEILQKGGNALDAAIAMQMVLNVVEPQSSGIGGGGFLLLYNKATDKVVAFDGRETAPRKVHEKWFLDQNGSSLPISKLISSGRSVGVPGLIKMLELAHKNYGILFWRNLFEPAIDLAMKGFPMSPRLHQLVASTPLSKLNGEAQEYLYHASMPKKEGEILKNAILAETLLILAEKGSEGFYQGKVAKAIVSAVQSEGGVIEEEDLAQYQAIQRDPITTYYRDYIVYGFPPPSAGGIAVAQMLKMAETQNLEKETLGSARFIDFFSGISRLAYADKDYYLADPDFFPVPIFSLLNAHYLRGRVKAFSRHKRVQPGRFPGETPTCCPPLIASTELEFPSTTHLCVVDSEGNCACLTSSIEHAFGSGLMAAGFFLNNELTDFSLIPERRGNKAANRIESHKRPTSSMSPTLVFKKEDGSFFLATGSAGGWRIIDYVAKILFGVLDFQMTIQEAISFPNFASQKSSIDLESNSFLVKEVPLLERLGNSVNLIPLTSGSQGIQLLNGEYIGAADPRREGVAEGK